MIKITFYDCKLFLKKKDHLFFIVLSDRPILRYSLAAAWADVKHLSCEKSASSERGFIHSSMAS